MSSTTWEDDLSSIKSQWTLKLSTSPSGDLCREQRLPALVLMLSKKLEGCPLFSHFKEWGLQVKDWTHQTHGQGAGVVFFSEGSFCYSEWNAHADCYFEWRYLEWRTILGPKTPMTRQNVEHCSCIGSKGHSMICRNRRKSDILNIKMETQATRIFNMRMTWFSFLFVSIVLCFETTFPHTSTGLSNTRFWWLTVIETMSTAPTTLRPKHMVQEMFRQSTHLFWFIVFIDRKDVLKLQNPWNYLQHAAFWKISFQSFGSAGWCFFLTRPTHNSK